ncbi:3-keto-5-aminohexanoate cleavage protein [Burkholderia dolosa]|jgi:uncharacterized protein (DUF849 family)|uniref:3-keto-5-aminohexanoate cleavage protein n=1 Tax=Burkholderia dolosa TaxID=152500 RepID=UPI001B98D286|nr:3-keto-5-aminohexanoate cleavage protein [Burkholderia dolosa]MBR8059884.1 3-keto-5-aminohexanoate cleavage protein [Burkholderia dolosa]MBR8456542.1 3-keto-5-aminohexanoate cleavage protein [Burkholderia dolosa]MBY4830921.1 3-keto-5-aminohexanoate cleavage protein [Burkholderia dolosa]MDN7424334.1 3-keto-5-aminohexanoate cleavage protein [Burkholderia dolosa]
MTSKTIISCAVTGNIVTRDHHPRLPVTPAEIAQAALDAASAGASIAHIHVREPDTGKPSMRVDLYAEVVERIRARNRDLIINLTTGEGGRFTPSEHDPKEAAPGSTLTLPENRVAHVVAIRPDMCSLDFNTMNSGSNVVINTPTNVRKMANAIVAAGVMPEIEVFDSGDIHMARDLIDEGTLPGPHLFQIVTGVKYGASSTGATLLYLKSLLPLECQWSAFGLGRMEFPMVAQAFLLGGHVRVGFEDNVYISKGRLARDNAELVEKCASLLHMLGGDVASPQEARSMLGLRPQN